MHTRPIGPLNGDLAKSRESRAARPRHRGAIRGSRTSIRRSDLVSRQTGQDVTNVAMKEHSHTRKPLTGFSAGEGLLSCAPEGIRTPNLLIRSQVLYPLSYGRMFCCLADLACLAVVLSIISNPPVKITGLAEARGFEPPVPRKRDNSLAVSPIRPLWHASLGVPILSDRRIERLHTLRHQRQNAWSAP